MKSKKTGKRIELNFSNERNRERISVLEHLMRERARTAKELVEEGGYSEGVIATFLAHLKPQIHIGSWVRSGPNWVPAYSWGRKPDVPRPKGGEVANGLLPGPKPCPYSREERIRRADHFKPQPAQRDWSVAMVFGPAGAHA